MSTERVRTGTYAQHTNRYSTVTTILTREKHQLDVAKSGPKPLNNRSAVASERQGGCRTALQGRWRENTTAHAHIWQHPKQQTWRPMTDQRRRVSLPNNFHLYKPQHLAGVRHLVNHEIHAPCVKYTFGAASFPACRPATTRTPTTGAADPAATDDAPAVTATRSRGRAAVGGPSACCAPSGYLRLPLGQVCVVLEPFQNFDGLRVCVRVGLAFIYREGEREAWAATQTRNKRRKSGVGPLRDNRYCITPLYVEKQKKQCAKSTGDAMSLCHPVHRVSLGG